MPNYYTGRSAGKTGTTENGWDAWYCGFDAGSRPRSGWAIRKPPRDEGVFGATYCVPIWGTFYNSVFGSTYIPDFATPAIMPLWKPWEGKYFKMAPSPSPSPSPWTTKTPKPGTTKSSTPNPTPSHTVTPTHTPTPTPTNTKP